MERISLVFNVWRNLFREEIFLQVTAKTFFFDLLSVPDDEYFGVLRKWFICSGVMLKIFGDMTF